MPMVIFRHSNEQLWCYVAKLDLEARVMAVEFDNAERWGGRVEIEGDKVWYVQPQQPRPRFPVSLRATRAE
ncbi:NifT/FixU family protein [Pantoea sp. B65]|uniref:NifT/FixU family protein n=1 Tax=Pantoea sp. B65 TaxID=2813359 RepID=UPI0039B48C5A